MLPAYATDWHIMTFILAAAIAASGTMVTLALMRVAAALEKNQPPK